MVCFPNWQAAHLGTVLSLEAVLWRPARLMVLMPPSVSRKHHSTWPSPEMISPLARPTSLVQHPGGVIGVTKSSGSKVIDMEAPVSQMTSKVWLGLMAVLAFNGAMKAGIASEGWDTSAGLESVGAM